MSPHQVIECEYLFIETTETFYVSLKTSTYSLGPLKLFFRNMNTLNACFWIASLHYWSAVSLGVLIFTGEGRTIAKE